MGIVGSVSMSDESAGIIESIGIIESVGMSDESIEIIESVNNAGSANNEISGDGISNGAGLTTVVNEIN